MPGKNRPSKQRRSMEPRGSIELPGSAQLKKHPKQQRLHNAQRKTEVVYLRPNRVPPVLDS